MSGTASNVSVGKPQAAGGVHAGPTSTTAPTSALTTLPQALKALGYVSDEGLTNGIETETADITAWGGDRVLSVRTSRSESFSWTFIESLNEDVLAECYGPNNVSSAGGELTVIHNSEELPARMYVFEILMTGDRVKRIVVPNGKIDEVGDVVYVDGEPVGYTVTLACYPDSNGNTVYEYIAALDGGSGSA